MGGRHTTLGDQREHRPSEDLDDLGPRAGHRWLYGSDRLWPVIPTVNLSPDKPAVFREAFRVLRAGGRLAISDVVATGAIPAELQNQAEALAACIAGAALLDDVRAMLAAAGFVNVNVPYGSAPPA